MTSTKMQWGTLLSGIRLKDREVKDRTQHNPFDLRNDFEDDYARLVFSSAVRRLQDKAQVFPLDNSDFVRTRLTHSLEVSAIGRSLGTSVEHNIFRSGRLHEAHLGKISSLLAASGLVHDLGNPPYGHFGEAAIQGYFKSWFKNNAMGQSISKEILGELNPNAVADLENFEGNAQTFRLLTKLNGLRDQYSYNLSVATLASILKYPRSSVEGNKDGDYRKTHKLGISYKKFGYMQSEQAVFEDVREFTGIERFRHPLTFLMEAADDIAYCAADLEDGCKKKVLDYGTLTDVLAQYLSNGTAAERELLDKFHATYQLNKEQNRPDRLDNAVQQFRIVAQGFMIGTVVKTFVERHDDILNGDLDDELLSVSEAVNVRNMFKKLAEVIFKDKIIVTRELVGATVIKGLLEMFVPAVLSDNRLNMKTEEGKLYSLISDNYRFIIDHYPLHRNDQKPSAYDRLLLVTDFICGMTDSYALELYRRLSGITL